MLYQLFILYVVLPLITATTQQYRPKQCLRYRENDIFLDTCPAYFQDTIEFSAALFPDPVVLSNLSKSNHISATESTKDSQHASSTPSTNRSEHNDNTKPLMSFEEWQKKIKQNESDKDRSGNRFKRKPNTEERQQMVDSVDGGFSDDFGAMLEGFMGTSKKSPNVYAEGEYISPSDSGKSGNKKPFADVRIKSLKERFNYASIDCAATVRKANPEAKGAQSILYESKDQYLLNKCSANKFVILNLCEQIVVDTIVMANFEFFSSTFKDFRVYASSKYPTNEWKLLGQWQARNTRDLQVFKVPDSGFVEYLKIELLTHYGHEYYCPLSLVRVHGMTNMEYYTIVESQDQDPSVENEHLWPAEVREHIIQPELGITNVSESFQVKLDTEESEDKEPIIAPINPTPLPTFDVPEIDLDLLKDTPTIESYMKEEKHETLEIQHSDESESFIPVVSATEELEISENTPTYSSMIQSSDTTIPAETLQIPDPSSLSSSLSDFVTSISSSHSETPTEEATPDEETPNALDTETAEISNTTSTTTSSTTTQKQNLHTKESSNQESIYKTIMKRLNVLEQNMKLSQRFLDDQNKILNDVFVDMEKKHQDQLILLIGHLNETASQKIDHMERRYEQWYQDLKEQNENDSRDMNAKISIIADQLSFERKLSISNFIIMIGFFVYMALSRGTFSTLSPVVAAQQQERKRRESLSSKTKIALDSLIENRMKTIPRKSDAVVPNPIDENKLYAFLNKSKETTPKKPSNPRRHSDSPYHTMKNIDMHVPTTTAEKSGKPTISRQSSDNDRKTPKSRQLSRNASNESINNNLQSDVLYQKLDDLVVEQRRQETQNPLRIGKSFHSSLENLKSRERNGSSSSL